jgi:hypothetical protein
MNLPVITKDMLQDFDLLFCVRDTALSEAIRAVSASEFSHVGHVRVKAGRVSVVDAQADGYSAKKWEDWVAKYGYKFIVMRLPNLTADKITELDAREHLLIGKEYDHKGLLVDQPKKQITKLLNKFRRKDKEAHARQKNADARLYCSEAEATLYGAERTDLTPQEFLEWTIDQGAKMIKPI